MFPYPSETIYLTVHKHEGNKSIIDMLATLRIFRQELCYTSYIEHYALSHVVN